QELYVDGGVTGNIIYGGRMAEEDGLPALWHKAYPNLPILKFRYWVIFNNQFPPAAAGDTAELGGGYSAEPAQGHAGFDGDRCAPSLGDGGDGEAKAEGGRGVTPGVDPR